MIISAGKFRQPAGSLKGGGFGGEVESIANGNGKGEDLGLHEVQGGGEKKGVVDELKSVLELVIEKGGIARV